jgi:hypothetical protein
MIPMFIKKLKSETPSLAMGRRFEIARKRDESPCN